MEEVGGTSTSRLLVLLLREREREELEKEEKKESAFTTVRNSLSRKFSFRKVKVETKEQTLNEEKQFYKRIFFKLTNTFRKSVRKSSPEKKLEEEEEKEEDNQPSGRDSAYFSQSNCCCSKSLSETHKHSEAANNTIERSSALSITSSRCSSVTTSANLILPNTSEKKKSVTILLPNKHTTGRPFGPHLRIQNTKLFKLPPGNSNNKGNVSNQLKKIRDEAKQDLLEQFPSITTTIHHLFTDNLKPLLMSLSSSKIGDLIVNLRTLLFSPLLPMITSLDIILFQIIKFLHAVTLVLDCAEHKWADNELKKVYQNISSIDCLDNIKKVFIIIWISVMLKD